MLADRGAQKDVSTELTIEKHLPTASTIMAYIMQTTRTNPAALVAVPARYDLSYVND